jgi:membrane protein implicated in regulation of membrane protease activity
MSWWLWLILGLVLTALELLSTGGFYLIFFGISALVIGTLQLVGFAGPAWLQWFLFTSTAFVALLLFRSPLLRILRPANVAVDQLAGAIAIPVDDIPVGEVGRAELRGTGWSARNAHHGPLAKGQRCRVQSVDGLMIFLVPE